MSTSVTNSTTRFSRTFISYLAMAAFLFIFSRIYESLSYGEVSVFMHYMFCATLVGGILLLGLLQVKPNLSRMTYNLWNSGIATITAGCLLRGIINLSGRSTTLDQPYWYVGAGFLALSLITLFISDTRRTRQKSTA
ncbi:TPA: hypothetical protein ACGO6Q_001636 [Streptococcus suis]|uniref:hypothetical protein n=1 Tax=Streptococcus parasuis TaxID=1501662 RepID=UPI001DC7C7F2|nr:hypothetical protein [Streptococcus parasuis]MCA9760501.1 hypothetical protein [Streptococcus sp.]HEM3619086.1 hypothetical protein [Streptococcus suis]HEM3665594.1 hypothetical protein [Streptococcus suis]HEM3671927.1 hypothetical protein [Streptococcus suis]HEM3688465.1 hypothetical protein [Streptococcus suis]